MVLSYDFVEWFRGFTDAEGSFIIAKRNGNIFSFNFVIGLHIDDKDALYYIHNTLRLGLVTLDPSRSSVRFIIRTQAEISVLIELFTQNPLNTPKHINFGDFAKVFNIYMENSSTEARSNTKPLIYDIMIGMNTKRADFYLPFYHYRITPYWLLGFVEGDGWFSYHPESR